MSSPLSRRHFLRASGVSMALPFLNAMIPRGARAVAALEKPRTVAINVGLGLHVENTIPTETGQDYALTPYLQKLADFREDLTVISGTSLPGVDGGHSAEKSFLTGAASPSSASFRNSISLDQVMAQEIGAATRFSYLPLSLSGRSLSWSRSGVEIPSESRPSQVFARLFLEGKPEEKAATVQRLKDGQSIMDLVMDRAKSMERRLDHQDREKLDEYFSAVRDTEKRLHKAEEWEYRPRPVVKAEPPQDISDKTDIIGKGRLMYDMMHLALQTDSTRVITFFKNGINAVPPIKGVTGDYHNMSHHGKDPDKLKQLAIIEGYQMQIFAEFLQKLKSTKEGNGTLLDHTQILLGSNLGNASSHNNRNLPIILAGGGYQHGQHLAFDQDHNYPLSNLYVTMLQRMGIETDQFSTGTSTMTGMALG